MGSANKLHFLLRFPPLFVKVSLILLLSLNLIPFNDMDTKLTTSRLTLSNIYRIWKRSMHSACSWKELSKNCGDNFKR